MADKITVYVYAQGHKLEGHEVPRAEIDAHQHDEHAPHWTVFTGSPFAIAQTGSSFAFRPEAFYKQASRVLIYAAYCAGQPASTGHDRELVQQGIELAGGYWDYNGSGTHCEKFRDLLASENVQQFDHDTRVLLLRAEAACRRLESN